MADDGKSVFDVVTDVGKSVWNKSGLGKLTDSVDRLFGKKSGTGGSKIPYTGAKFEGELDYRAKIRVPHEYLYAASSTGMYGGWQYGGVLFPYTPTISQDYNAVYNTMNPTHSNYALHFYKHSAPGPITVSGKFTVQNNREALVWLATVHLLRALTKMKFGNDVEAGAPPPVCRFDAYGDMQYKNVPVVIQSVKIELPDNVDYYATSVKQETYEDGTSSNDPLGNMVPVSSTIVVTMLPMYSRKELLAMGQVDDYLNGRPNLRQQGYL